MLVLTILLALFASCHATVEVEEGVLVLTKDNFDEAIKEHEFILVEFYAPWCGHCKALAPEYAKAAQALEEQGSPIKLGKVDSTIHTDLASKFEVQGYPTLKFFKNGSPVEYNGPRQSEGIINWLKKKTGPPMVPVTSKADLDKLKEENRVVVVHFTTDESSKDAKVVKDLAFSMDSVVFGVVTDKSLFSELSAPGDGKIVLYKKFDDPVVVFEGSVNVEDLKKFIGLEIVPLVTEFTQQSAQIVFESEVKKHLVAFASKKTAAEYEQHMKDMEAVSRKFKGLIHSVMFNTDEEENLKIGEYFDIAKDDVPTFRMINMAGGDMLKYKPESASFDKANMESFVQQVLDGKVKPHLKSQDEASDWNANSVKVLVSKTFKERAVHKDKAVFVEFYAPWCGHCKALAPVWDQLGDAFASDADVMIAKMDSTENQLEDISISGFPTLKFSPKGREDFIDYKGDRTLEALKKFVQSNGEDSGSSDATEAEGHDEL